MIVALLSGSILTGVALSLAVRRGRGFLPGNLFVLGATWGAGLLGLAAFSAILDFDAGGLTHVVLPLVAVLLLASPAWLRPREAFNGTNPGNRAGGGWATVAAAMGLVALALVSYDSARTAAIAGNSGWGLALAEARGLRQEGSFYPAWMLPLNSLRVFAAPVAWSVRECLPEGGRWRRLTTVAAIFGLLGTLSTTGRSLFVLNVLWMVGISWNSRGSQWGWAGLCRRLAGVGLAGGTFFIAFGLLIGKTGESLAVRLLGAAEVEPVLAALLALAVYVFGPIAAVANSTFHAAGPEFAWNLFYAPLRVLGVLGFDVPAFSRSLPYVNIPEPFNTYTFLGPAWWSGGAGGLVAYLCVIVLLLVVSERVLGRERSVQGLLLNGYLLSACVLSLSSDYFLSAGFALLLYALLAAAWLYASLAGRSGR